MTIDIKFWGVRGSIPSPLTPVQVESKIQHVVKQVAAGVPYDQLRFDERSTFGGNTTCVEVNCLDKLFILDMGTGVRECGKQQVKNLMQSTSKSLNGTILQSHVHWDHIQGLPFWGPMYLPRRQFDCSFDFFGGKQWDSKLDQVYRGQMDAPYFPVNLQELEQTAMKMSFSTVHDGWTSHWHTTWSDKNPVSRIDVLARKLFHPQETFGYRITMGDKKIAFTTDHEPFAMGLPRGLLELVSDVDVWITDCQYSHGEYIGEVGPQKMGWGHSFPEYIANVAKEAKPKSIVTTHHDPDASDEHIVHLAQLVQQMCSIETKPAFEGMFISI